MDAKREEPIFSSCEIKAIEEIRVTDLFSQLVSGYSIFVDCP